MKRRATPNAQTIPVTPQLLFVSGWLLAAMLALSIAAQLG